MIFSHPRRRTAMQWRPSVLLAAIPLVVPFASCAGDKKGDLELLQGTWVLVAAEENGNPLPAVEITAYKAFEFTISGEKVVGKLYPEKLPKSGGYGKEPIPTMTFKLDPKANPKSVDLTLSWGPKDTYVHLGIYSLEGDKLILCLGGRREKRPADFKSGLMGVFNRKPEK
jgi:uncharacterized protein (TIGR03067 family)